MTDAAPSPPTAPAPPLAPEIDWTTLPVPKDDGAADHLRRLALPSVLLPATGGGTVDLSALSGLTVVFCYPKTGRPGHALAADWDAIPGARGCTNQSCAFRDAYGDLLTAGANAVFGLSVQTTAWQSEARARLGLPYELLSDAEGAFAAALRLPTFEAGAEVLLKRLTFVARDGVIDAVIYPVFPPDGDARAVLSLLSSLRAD